MTDFSKKVFGVNGRALDPRSVKLSDHIGSLSLEDAGFTL